MVQQEMNWKWLWQAWLWFNQGTVLQIADGTEENDNNPIRLFGIPAEIQV
jgi:hypothetical protein